MVGHPNLSSTGFKVRKHEPGISEARGSAATTRTPAVQRTSSAVKRFGVGAIVVAETILGYAGCGVNATESRSDVPGDRMPPAERNDATRADGQVLDATSDPDVGIDSTVPFDTPQVGDVPSLPELPGACPTLTPMQCNGPLAMVARTIPFGGAAWFGSFGVTVSTTDPAGGLPAVNVGVFNPRCGEWGGGGWHMHPTPRQEGERLSVNVYEGRTEDGGIRNGTYSVQVRRVDATAATIAVIRNCTGYCNPGEVSRTGDLSVDSPRLELPTVALTMLRILPGTVYFELERTTDCEGAGCRVRFSVPTEPDGRIRSVFGFDLPPDVRVDVAGTVLYRSVDGGIIDGGSTRDGGVDGSTGVVVRATVRVQVCSHYDYETYPRGDAGYGADRDVPPSDAYASMCALTTPLSPFSCRENPYQYRVLTVSPTSTAPGTDYLSLGSGLLALNGATPPTETTPGFVRYAVWYDRCRNGGFSSTDEGEGVLYFGRTVVFSFGVQYVFDSRRATVDLRYAQITPECPRPTTRPPSITLTDSSTRMPISRTVLTVGSPIRFADLESDQAYAVSIIGSPRLVGSEYVADLLVVKPGASRDEPVMRHRFDSSGLHNRGGFMVPERGGRSAVFYGVLVESISARAVVVTITGAREIQP